MSLVAGHAKGVLLNGDSHWNLQKRLASDLKEGDEVRLSPIVTGG